jgi:hypothetical protein
MLASALVSGTSHAQHTENDICYEQFRDWLQDGELLRDWQVQLVDSCNAIHEQLTQIRQGLGECPTADDASSSPISLWIARD